MLTLITSRAGYEIQEAINIFRLIFIILSQFEGHVTYNI